VADTACGEYLDRPDGLSRYGDGVDIKADSCLRVADGHLRAEAGPIPERRAITTERSGFAPDRAVDIATRKGGADLRDAGDPARRRAPSSSIAPRRHRAIRNPRPASTKPRRTEAGLPRPAHPEIAPDGPSLALPPGAHEPEFSQADIGAIFPGPRPAPGSDKRGREKKKRKSGHRSSAKKMRQSHRIWKSLFAAPPAAMFIVNPRLKALQ